MLKIANNFLENLLILENMAKKDKMMGGDISSRIIENLFQSKNLKNLSKTKVLKQTSQTLILVAYLLT